jgi:hypothetical protein
MKKIGKILIGFVIAIYAVVAIFSTICLLNYNDFKVTVFDDTALVIVKKDALDGDYKKGSLLLVEKSEKSYKKGDEIIFFNTYDGKNELTIAKVLEYKEINKAETTYTIEGDFDVSSQYVIGSTKTVKQIPVFGTILGAFESRVGFLVLVIFPVALAFLYEVYMLIEEIKEEKEGKN